MLFFALPSKIGLSLLVKQEHSSLDYLRRAQTEWLSMAFMLGAYGSTVLVFYAGIMILGWDTEPRD